MSNVASDVGYVLVIPLAGIIFHSLGRHPLVGMAAAFAGVSGGFSANLLLGTVDPYCRLSTEAAQIIDSTYEVIQLQITIYGLASTYYRRLWPGAPWVTRKK